MPMEFVCFADVDHLDEPLKADVETVAAAEGDRAIRTNPRSYAPGNTGAEENARYQRTILAYCMFLNTRMREMEKQQSSLR